MIVATMSGGHQSRGAFHTFSDFPFKLQRQHDFERFTAVAGVRLQLQETKLRMTVDAMMRQAGERNVCHNFRVFRLLLGLEPMSRLVLSD